MAALAPLEGAATHGPFRIPRPLYIAADGDVKAQEVVAASRGRKRPRGSGWGRPAWG